MSADPYADLLGQLKGLDQIAEAGMPPAAPPPPPSIPRLNAMPEDPSLAEFGSNMARSGQDEVRGMMEAFRNPMEAARAVASLLTDQSTRAAFMSYMKESYGSMDNFKRSLYNDPVGVIAEISSVGLPIKGFGGLMKMPKLARFGAALEQADPSIAATSAAKMGAAQAAGAYSDPQKTYENALRMSVSPTSKYSRADVRNRVTGRLLDDQVDLTPEGIAAYQKKISAMTRELDAKIEAADRAGTTISISSLMQSMRPFLADISDPITNPSARAETTFVRNYFNDWLKGLGPVRELTPSQVRTLRQNLDNQIRWGSVDQTTPSIGKRTTESLANAARANLADSLDPEGVTAKDIGGALEALEPAERASARLSNNNRFGLREAGALGTGLMAGSMGDTFLERALPMVASGAAAYLFNYDTKMKIARAIWRNKSLDEAAKRTYIRQLVNTSAGAGMNTQEFQDEQ